MKHLFRAPTVAEIAESYLQQCRIGVKRSTRSTYSIIISRHILPSYGNRRVTSLRSAELNEFLASKAGAEQEGLSASTVCSLVTMLRALLNHAQELGFKTAPPAAIRRPACQPAAASIFSPDEQQRLRLYCVNHPGPDTLGILLGLCAGLRIGEVCALRWEDISLETGMLSVRRTVQRIRNDGAGPGGPKTLLIIDTPKSRSSLRAIPLPGFLTALLRRCRMQLHASEKDYLLSSCPTRPTEPRVFEARYKAHLEAAGVPYRKYHALRHSFATGCAELGVDPKMLSEILGHADVSVTYNVYVHPSLAAKRRVMELLAQ